MSNRRLGGGRTWMVKRLGTAVTAGVAAATALTACGAGTTGSSSARNSVILAEAYRRDIRGMTHWARESPTRVMATVA